MTSTQKILGPLLGALCVVCIGHALAEDKPRSADKPTAEPGNKSVAAPEAKEAAGGPDAEPEELAQVERELAEVMDELVAARARAAVLAQNLFHTELAVELQRSADAQNVSRVSLRLDGVSVHDSDGSALGEKSAQLFKGYLTPGRHELSIELTEASKDDSSYGYTRSERYRIEVKKDRRTRVQLRIDDDSDMAEQAAEGDEGEYQVETTVRVTSERVGD